MLRKIEELLNGLTSSNSTEEKVIADTTLLLEIALFDRWYIIIINKAVRTTEFNKISIIVVIT